MNTLIPLGIFLIIQMTIRHYNQKAQPTLSVEDKAKLLDQLSGFYLQQMLPIVVLLLAFGVFMYLDPSIFAMAVGLFIYVALIGLSSIYNQRMIVKKLSSINLPDGYIAHRKKFSLIQTFSLILFLTWILGSTIWTMHGLNG